METKPEELGKLETDIATAARACFLMEMKPGECKSAIVYGAGGEVYRVIVGRDK